MSESVSGELFRAIFQSSLDGLALLRLVADEAGAPSDFVYVAVNRAFEQMTGRSRPEVVGRRWAHVFPEANWKWVKEHLLPVAFNGEVYHFELFSEVLKQHVEAVAYAPAPGYLLFSFRDVSERHQREQQLDAIARVAESLRGARRPADLFSTTLEQVRALLHVEGAAIALRQEGNRLRFEAATGAWQQVEGISLGAGEGISGRVMATGRPFVSTNLAEEETLAVSDLFSRAMAGVCAPLTAGDNFVGALWIIRQHPFTAAELHLLETVANMVAATLERVTLFEQVENQVLQMQRMMDAMEEGLLLLNGEKEIVLANPAAERYLALLGLEADARRGWPLPGGRSLESLLEPPPPGTLAHELVVQNPRPHTFELLAHPVAEGLDGFAGGGWVLVVRDVTEERRIQERIQQQERLAAVGQLAAGVAHDFNNLLSAIVLYAQILQQSPGLDEKDRRRMSLIYRQATQASDLIRQILDFSRRSVLTRMELDLVPLLSESVSLLLRTLPETIDIAWSAPPHGYWLEGDRTRLQQILLNLGINARDALPDGGSFAVTLSHFHVGTGEPAPLPELPPGEWARLEVCDDGMGIAESDLPHIFEPFFTTRAPGEGAGLGLAQVYGIVHQHGGRIRAESALGEGATFTIFLPLLAPVEAEGSEQSATEAAEAGAATILVVEDEQAVRDALAATLEMLGYRVLVADDGHTALALFAEIGEQIDLVLSDLVMARMGGEELYRRLHALRPELKMIVMTGYPLQDAGKALLEHGIVGWIQKPVTLEAVEARVTEALGS